MTAAEALTITHAAQRIAKQRRQSDITRVVTLILELVRLAAEAAGFDARMKFSEIDDGETILVDPEVRSRLERLGYHVVLDRIDLAAGRPPDVLIVRWNEVSLPGCRSRT